MQFFNRRFGWATSRLGSSTLPSDSLLEYNKAVTDEVFVNSVSAYPDYELEPKQSYCLDFDGVGDYVTPDALWDFSEGCTFSCWIKTSTSQTGYIISQLGGDTANANSEFKVQFYNGSLNIVINGGYVTFGSGYSDGEPHNIYFTIGETTTEVYVDDTMLTITHGTPYTSTTNYIGCKYDIDTLFEGSVWGIEGSVMSYRMCEGSGDILYDTSGTGNNATITSTSGIDVMRAGTQDVYHGNLINGCSKAVLFDDGYGEVTTDIDIDEYSGYIRFNKQSDSTEYGYIIDTRTEDDVGFRVLWVGSGTEKLYISHNEYDLIIDMPVSDGEWHTLYFSKTETALIGILDDITYTLDDVSDHLISSSICIGRGNYYTTDFLDGYISDFTFSDVGEYKIANATDTTIPDISDNGNDITLYDTDIIYLPALDDGTDDVLGLGFTNKAAGSKIKTGKVCIHNNCETIFENYDDSLISHSTLWYTDDVVNQVTFTDAKAFVSLSDDHTVVDFESKNDVCHMVVNAIYDADKFLTTNEKLKVSSAYPNTCGAGVYTDPMVGSDLLELNKSYEDDVVVNEIISYPSYELTPKQSGCVVFDGVGDYATSSASTDVGDGDFYYRFVGKITGSDDDIIFIDGDTYTSHLILSIESANNTLELLYESTTTFNDNAISVPFSYSNTDEVELIITRVDDGVTFTYNNITTDVAVGWSDTESEGIVSFSNDGGITIGGSMSNSVATDLSSCEVYKFQVGESADSLTVNYQCAECDGNVLYDTSGNGNHATITSTSGIDVMRAGRQDLYHTNLENGFSTESVADFDITIQQVTFTDDGTPTTIYAIDGIDDLSWDGTYYSQTDDSITTATANGYTDWITVWDGNTYTRDEIEAWGDWKENCNIISTVDSVLTQLVCTSNMPRDYSVTLDDEYGTWEMDDLSYPFSIACRITPEFINGTRGMVTIADSSSDIKSVEIGCIDGYVFGRIRNTSFYDGVTTTYISAGETVTIKYVGESSTERYLYVDDVLIETYTDEVSLPSGLTSVYTSGFIRSSGRVDDAPGDYEYVCVNEEEFNLNEASGSKFYGTDGTVGTWYDDDDVEDSPTYTVVDGQVSMLAGVQLVSVFSSGDTITGSSISTSADLTSVDSLFASVSVPLTVNGTESTGGIASRLTSIYEFAALIDGSTLYRSGGTMAVGTYTVSGWDTSTGNVYCGDYSTIYDDVLNFVGTDTDPIALVNGPVQVVYTSLSADVDYRLIPSLGNLGMYDTVSGTYYANEGTGDLGLIQIPTIGDYDVNGFDLLTEWVTLRDEALILDSIAGENYYIPVIGVNYPVLDDGTDDVLGLGLTNKAITGNIIHNGAETLYENYDSSDLYHSTLWYEEDTALQVSYTDAIEFVSLSDSATVVNFEEIDDIYYMTVNAVYASDRDFTPSEYIQILSLYPNDCGGGVAVPYEVTSGGIGPDGTWYDGSDGTIVLVLPDSE